MRKHKWRRRAGTMGSKALEAFLGSEVDVAALLDASGQTIHDVGQSVEFHLVRIGDRAVDLGGEFQQAAPKGLPGNASRFVKSPVEQMAHGDVQPLDGTAGFLRPGSFLLWQHRMVSFGKGTNFCGVPDSPLRAAARRRGRISPARGSSPGWRGPSCGWIRGSTRRCGG